MIRFHALSYLTILSYHSSGALAGSCSRGPHPAPFYLPLPGLYTVQLYCNVEVIGGGGQCGAWEARVARPRWRAVVGMGQPPLTHDRAAMLPSEREDLQAVIVGVTDVNLVPNHSQLTCIVEQP